MPKMYLGRNLVSPVIQSATRIDDTDLVHKTGNETVNGNKTFTSDVILKRVAVPETQEEISEIKYIDRNTEARTGGVRNRLTSGEDITEIYVANGTTYQAGILVGINGSSKSFRLSDQIAASNSTNSKEIATVGWVNNPSLSTNVVHRTGNESIGGTKTFTKSTFMQSENDMAYNIKSINADNSVSSQSVETLGSFRVVDKNNKIIGDTRFYRTTDGTSKAMLLARNYANTTAELGNQGIISVQVSNSGVITTSAPTPTSATDNSTQIATTAWVKSHNAIDTALVHTTGSETIKGEKTFNAKNISLKSLDIDITDASTGGGNSYEHIGMFDKNGKEFGHFKSIFNNGKITTEIAANPDGGTESFKQISVTVDTTNNSVTTKAPTPSDTTSTSATQIATTGWVNTVGNNVVHRTGDETVAGRKTLSNYPILATNTTEDRYFCKLLNYTQGTAPTSNIYGGFRVLDSANVEMGTFYTVLYSGGNSRSGMMVKAPISGSTSSSQLYVQIDSSGNISTYAPTPPANSNNNNIATTGWVKSSGFTMPNYDSPTTISVTRGTEKSWTATGNGTLHVNYYGSDSYVQITYNGVVLDANATDLHKKNLCAWCFVQKGKTYKILAGGDSGETITCRFYPFA